MVSRSISDLTDMAPVVSEMRNGIGLPDSADTNRRWFFITFIHSIPYVIVNTHNLLSLLTLTFYSVADDVLDPSVLVYGCHCKHFRSLVRGKHTLNACLESNTFCSQCTLTARKKRRSVILSLRPGTRCSVDRP